MSLPGSLPKLCPSLVVIICEVFPMDLLYLWHSPSGQRHALLHLKDFRFAAPLLAQSTVAMGQHEVSWWNQQGVAQQPPKDLAVKRQDAVEWGEKGSHWCSGVFFPLSDLSQVMEGAQVSHSVSQPKTWVLAPLNLSLSLTQKGRKKYLNHSSILLMISYVSLQLFTL